MTILQTVTLLEKAFSKSLGKSFLNEQQPIQDCLNRLLFYVGLRIYASLTLQKK